MRGKINKIIDFLNDRGIIDKKMDLFLHFVNEAILCGNYDLFLKNVVRYEILKKKHH